jgi:hypothetical protein
MDGHVLLARWKCILDELIGYQLTKFENTVP